MTTVRIPAPEDDRLPWVATLAAAVMGVTLGLGVAWWGMEREPVAGGEGVAEPETAAEPETPEPETPEPETPEPETPEPETPEPETPEPETPEPETPEPETAGPETTTETGTERIPTPTVEPGSGPPSGLSLRPGRVAYLRCEGVPQIEGPFPCPRDEVLERSVWTALGALERCPGLDRPGSADLVVDFDGVDAPAIRLRDTFATDVVRLDERALLACAARLSEVRTTLRPRRLVVSFRLSLEAVR